jgi:hypothetical protein
MITVIQSWHLYDTWRRNHLDCKSTHGSVQRCPCGTMGHILCTLILANLQRRQARVQLFFWQALSAPASISSGINRWNQRCPSTTVTTHLRTSADGGPEYRHIDGRDRRALLPPSIRMRFTVRFRSRQPRQPLRIPSGHNSLCG